MPKGIPVKDGKATRQVIQEAAIKVFAHKGFDAATTREICGKAGVTKPVLYYYFGCKEQLYGELIRDAFSEYREELLRAERNGNTTREKLIEIGTAVFTLTSRNPDRSRLIFNMMFAPQGYQLDVDYTGNWGIGVETVKKVLVAGIAKGEIRGEPGEIAAALVGIQSYCVMDFLLTGRRKLDRALASRLVDLLLLGAEKRTATGP